MKDAAQEAESAVQFQPKESDLMGQRECSAGKMHTPESPKRSVHDVQNTTQN